MTREPAGRPVLTGADTVASSFAAAAHRYGDRPALVGAGPVMTWAELGAWVRLVTLGLDARGVSPGTRVRVAVADPPGRRALELALACLGVVRAVAGDEALVVGDQDLAPLRAAGARVDDGDPDHFERRIRCVGVDAPAVEEGTTRWTQAQLLWAAHSLATSVEATAGDRVLSTLPTGDVTGWVCGALLPVVSGALTWADRGPGRAAVGSIRPTVLVCRDEDVAGFGLAGLSSPRPWRRRLPRLVGQGSGPPPGLEDCRVAVVVGGGPGAARLAAAGVPTRAAVTWPGHAGLVTGAPGPLGGLGRPLPGVSIGIDDGGEVLVRSESVAQGRCEDGWLHTGWQGEIDDAGRLFAVAGRVEGG